MKTMKSNRVLSKNKNSILIWCQKYLRMSFLRYSFILGLIVYGLWLTSDGIYKYAYGFYSMKESSIYKNDNFDNRNDIIKLDQITKSNLNKVDNLNSNNNLDQVPSMDKINGMNPGLYPDKTTVNYNASGTAFYPRRPEIGEEIGELYIPKLEAYLPIYHGTNEDELNKGVGHFAGSVLPGENDNSVLAGHRDTIFRKLGEVGEGDLLIIRTDAGEFKYKVDKVRIVDKDDRTVIVPKPRATLTVSTCYPFYFVGPAPDRYILVAYLESQTLNKLIKKD